MKTAAEILKTKPCSTVYTIAPTASVFDAVRLMADMVKAAALSVRQGFCDPKSFERITRLIKKAGLPTEFPPGMSVSSLVQGMEVDKKATAGQIKFVVSEGLGKTRFHWLAPGEILDALGG